MRREEIEALARMFGRKYTTAAHYRRAVRRALKRTGIEVFKAPYDNHGDCLVCGESGRCGGWHLLLPESFDARFEDGAF